MITADQIRAGRALVNWSQSELAGRAGLSTPAIGNIEIGKHRPTTETQKKIRAAFEDGNIEFIDGGVRHAQDVLHVIEGDDCYLKLLDDVYHTLRHAQDKELLISCADDRVSPPEVNESYRRIRASGVDMRQLVREGNTYLIGPLGEYRYIPKKFFFNRVTVIYGSKVALVLGDETKISIFKDTAMAEVQRNIFNLLWETMEKPKESLADDSF